MTTVRQSLAAHTIARPRRIGRRFLLVCILAIVFLVLVRTADLMVGRGNMYRTLADENRFFRIPLFAKRGTITDRNGETLARSDPRFFAINRASDLSLLSSPSAMLDDSQLLSTIATRSQSLAVRFRRVYPAGEALSPAVGYVGIPTQVALPMTLDTRVGKVGAEYLLDTQLQGTGGHRRVELDATGRITRSIETTEPRAGETVRLSIDATLTRAAYAAFAGRPGAAVVSDAASGEVLALVSSPSYTVASLSAALKSTQKPLLNRALLAYPPGSTFKMMTALAALESGKIDARTTIEDTGQLQAGDQVFRNWYFRQFGRVEGKVTIVQALSRSNDIFFYQIAAKSGVEAIDTTAARFGLGELTGLGLREEARGLLPNATWKEQTVGTKWFLGDTYNLGIGQGYVSATPAQINRMTATIARKGALCPLRITPERTPQCTDIDVNPENLTTIVDGMVAACSSGGTAFPFFSLNAGLPESRKIACKTGTAEFGATNAQGNKRTHGWLTLFYPVTSPKVAITVLVESTDSIPYAEGSTHAAPIALTIFSAWRETYE